MLNLPLRVIDKTWTIPCPTLWRRRKTQPPFSPPLLKTNLLLRQAKVPQQERSDRISHAGRTTHAPQTLGRDG
eukprot:6167210-Amphidinium_carterae.1